jgi:hypothetical protein
VSGSQAKASKIFVSIITRRGGMTSPGIINNPSYHIPMSARRLSRYREELHQPSQIENDSFDFVGIKLA